LLEEELAKEAKEKDNTIENSEIKKSFLKRKNEKSGQKNASAAKKTYKYYVDNFQKSEKDATPPQENKIAKITQKSRNSNGKHLISESSQGASGQNT
jgi:hypothetical protein